MKERRQKADKVFKVLVLCMGLLSLVVLAGIMSMLLWNCVAFFIQINPLDFFLQTEWSPSNRSKGEYGLLPLLVSSCFVTFGAMAIAVPLGIGTAAFLSEYAAPSLRDFLKPLIEILASIPSVAIGFLGIVVVGPFIARLFHLSNGLNALNGAVLLSVMCLPTIITISEDALNAVPFSYKEASMGLGADRWTTLVRVTLPAAAPGILAAILLGMGRALGETMTVLMATGNATAMPTGLLDSVRTITATIAIEMGEVPYQTTHYYALFAIAGVLFMLTFLVNLSGEKIAQHLRKFHE
jgi:phosphate transport system permease protein